MKHKVGAILIVGSFLGFSMAQGATLAHWDFAGSGSVAATNGAGLPDSDAYTVWREAATDKSGNGNHLTTGDYPASGFTWESESPAVDRSIKAAGASPSAFTWSVQSLPTGTDLELIAPTNFTVEALFTLAGSGYRTVVGRNAQNVSTMDAALAAFYLSVNPNNHPRVVISDENANTVMLEAPDVTLLAGTWYQMAVVKDESSISLYLNGTQIASTNVALAGLAIGATSGTDWHAGGWSVGRGLYNGGLGDHWLGYIDEVAIHDSALTPAQFLTTPAFQISVSPTDSATTTTRTLSAEIVNGGSTLTRAVLSLDGIPVATNSTPSGSTNAISYVANGLSVGVHTGAVVATGSPTSSSRTWTFEVLALVNQAGTVSWCYNVNGDAYSVQSNDVSGVEPAAYWNDSYLDGRTTDLLDDSGAVTTVDISWQSFNTYSVLQSHPGVDADGSHNREILNGYLNAGPASWNPPITYSAVTLSQITYADYDVLVYFSSDVAGREGYVTDGTTTNYFNTLGPASITDGSGNAVFVQATDTTTDGYAVSANYAVFTNLAGSAQTVKVQMRDDGEWGGIAAVQLVGKGATAPTVAPVIQSIGVAGGMVTLSWTAEDLGTYSIWRKTGLADASWDLVMTNLPSGNLTTNFTASAGQEFYQIKGE